MILNYKKREEIAKYNKKMWNWIGYKNQNKNGKTEEYL